MFNHLITTTSNVWLIKSQCEQLDESFSNRFIILSESKDVKYSFGDFLEYWSNQMNLSSVLFVEEHVWEEDIDAILKLKSNEEIVGTAINCVLDGADDVKEQIALNPVCRMSGKLSEFELGIKCLHFPDDIYI